MAVRRPRAGRTCVGPCQRHDSRAKERDQRRGCRSGAMTVHLEHQDPRIDSMYYRRIEGSSIDRPDTQHLWHLIACTEGIPDRNSVWICAGHVTGRAQAAAEHTGHRCACDGAGCRCCHCQHRQKPAAGWRVQWEAGGKNEYSLLVTKHLQVRV